MHWGDKCSPFLHLTILLSSDPNKSNLDSSLKWIIFHYSSVHRICSVVMSKRTFWFFFEIKGLQHGIQATNFSLFNLRETVFLEISFSVCSQNGWEIDVAVSKWHSNNHLIFLFGSHRRLASSWFLFKFLVSLKSTDYTINNAFWPLMVPAISEYDLPSLWFAKMRFFFFLS